MTEDDIRKLIQDEIRKKELESQNRPTPVPFHRHNKTDAPGVPADSLEYPLGYLILPNLTSVPTAQVPGGITVVNGTVYAFQTSSWVVVGTQT